MIVEDSETPNTGGYNDLNLRPKLGRDIVSLQVTALFQITETGGLENKFNGHVGTGTGSFCPLQYLPPHLRHGACATQGGVFAKVVARVACTNSVIGVVSHMATTLALVLLPRASPFKPRR